MTCEVEVLKEESDEEVGSGETKALADEVAEVRTSHHFLRCGRKLILSLNPSCYATSSGST